MRRDITAFIILGVVVIALAAFLVAQQNKGEAETAQVTGVLQPANLSQTGLQGRLLFRSGCAECHGSNAEGTDKGPPLLHPFYRPDHHSDGSFFLAARNGVRAHHWTFGDMPAQPDVTDADMASIVTYIRALQKVNGVF
ncbi:MAG: cytochrome c [Hyphomicrobiales bacterium]